MPRLRETPHAVRVELDALLGPGLEASSHAHEVHEAEDANDLGDLTTGELAAEIVAMVLTPLGSEPVAFVAPPPPTERAAFLASVASHLFDAHWRSRARTVARAPTVAPSTRRAPPRRARPALLARLAELGGRYPELVAAHRNLTEISDTLLAALVEDIEHLTGDRDDGSTGA